MYKIIKQFKKIYDRPIILYRHILHILSPIISDKLYIKFLYRIETNSKLNLDNPQTFNEKLQWLKLYNRKPEYTQMVDKYAVKEYVANIIGKEYIIPTLGVWDRFEDIDFDKLPNQFVLKTTHGGGGYGVVICVNKSQFDKNRAKKILNKSLKTCIYKWYKEWPYKNVKKRIIAETYLTDDISIDNPTGDLIDYKFYCFNGETKAVVIATERHSQTGVCFDYFDKDFNHLPFEQGGPNSKNVVNKPKRYEEMWNIANKLSKGLPHVRVDLYCIKGNIYFGELTFFDSSGFAEFNPNEWDYKFGEWITLPEKTE
uniref:ATP-grasp fold amidoligase family protein n=1 Tax=Alistipes sp. TaxID=1872444 RepID=UPI004057A4B0